MLRCTAPFIRFYMGISLESCRKHVGKSALKCLFEFIYKILVPKLLAQMSKS